MREKGASNVKFLLFFNKYFCNIKKVANFANKDYNQ